MKPSQNISQKNLLPDNTGLIEIAWTGPGQDKRLNRGKLLDPTRIEAIVDEIIGLNSVEGQNVYMSAGLRRQDANRSRRASRSDVVSVSAMWQDLDDQGAAATAPQKLIGLDLIPTLVVQTGAIPHNRTQLWFSLTAPSAELDRVENIIATLSRKLAGDKVLPKDVRAEVQQSESLAIQVLLV